MKKKRSKEMAAWLRWLRLHGACGEGVQFVRRYASPQKAWEALAAAGLCGWMQWLVDSRRETNVHSPNCPHANYGWADIDLYGAGVDAHRCAASILKRYPRVPDWRKA